MLKLHHIAKEQHLELRPTSVKIPYLTNCTAFVGPFIIDLTPQDLSLLSVTTLLNRLGLSILDKRTELGMGVIRLLVGRDKQPELAITITDNGQVFYE